MQARSDHSGIDDLDDLDDRIQRWVADLGADSGEVAENAQHRLASLGPQVLDRVMAAVPGLDYFGQLCAIEIFTELGDPRPASVLIELLAGESATVRERAAEALAELRIERAVPAIQAAYAVFRRSGEPPDYTEGVGLRAALTDLGGREQVLPSEGAALRVPVGLFRHAWPVEHLARVIGLLADHGQAVLYFQLWQARPEGRVFRAEFCQIDWAVDRALPWDRIVTHCRDWAQLAAAEASPRPGLVATIEWIAAADL